MGSIYTVPTTTEGFCFNFIFPQNIPSVYLDIFDSLLAQYCTFKKSEEKEADQQIVVQQDKATMTLQKVATGIDAGSNLLIKVTYPCNKTY